MVKFVEDTTRLSDAELLVLLGRMVDDVREGRRNGTSVVAETGEEVVYSIRIADTKPIPETSEKLYPRNHYTATVGGFGTGPVIEDCFKSSTILLKDIVKCDGHKYRDHVWVVLPRNISAVTLKVGDRIRFTAKSGPYKDAAGAEKKGLYKMGNVVPVTSEEESEVK